MNDNHERYLEAVVGDNGVAPQADAHGGPLPRASIDRLR